LRLVGTLFPHINDDARSKSHQTSWPVDSATCIELNSNVSTCMVQSTIHTWYSRPCDNFALFF